MEIKTIYYLAICIGLLTTACKNKQAGQPENKTATPKVSLVVLGTIQDAGSPQIGCTKNCCKSLFEHPDPNRQVVALGLSDNEEHKTYLFEATPDISRQVKQLKQYNPQTATEMPDGIFLTHAHIGHYTGLMYLGKEAANAQQVTVYAMPGMKTYLENNGPWSQLVAQKNILLTPLKNETPVPLTNNITVTAFTVPHRDEFSETVGYTIQGPNKKALFIPDIDKWEKWTKNIQEEIKNVDYAFIDATFYSGEEINNRDISTIPHPFVIESMERFKQLNETEKQKIIFIHFNHTNPLIDSTSKEYKKVAQAGFKIARKGQVFNL